MKKYILFILLLAGLCFSSATQAKDTLIVAPQPPAIVKGQIIEVVSQGQQPDEITGQQENIQQLQVKLLEGDMKGKTVDASNVLPLTFKKNDMVLVNIDAQADGSFQFSISDAYRQPSLYLLVGLFILITILVGHIQGFRGLVSLGLSLVFIFYVLIPGIIHGYPPLLMSLGVASLIIIIGSYITHGFNKTTTLAVVGMLITLVIIGLFAHYAIIWTKLTGHNTEEINYLNEDLKNLDFVGLLFGSIIIGLLGVLYDIAISQAIAIEELHRIAPTASWTTIYQRALRMGREHIGALVNTLAIAYVGISLPLLLLLYATPGGTGYTLNSEIFATEIVNAIVGSLGLILAVPITTLLSAIIIVKSKNNPSASTKDNIGISLHRH